ncbi:hypothetical protein K488DRAFT_82991 [Vararia minispora EC-137]|uniref:Uncharacterized protein n=1 Tax=Vararia minispora EC-137 TaxID=1314806 RepID=A0ACB8QV45_9AGAM|nr:hypothetical protein K488DRAFT_82991 [Vararia minispora EC-137]
MSSPSSSTKPVEDTDIATAAEQLAAQPAFIATVEAMPRDELIYMVALTYVGLKACILGAAVPDRSKQR